MPRSKGVSPLLQASKLRVGPPRPHLVRRDGRVQGEHGMDEAQAHEESRPCGDRHRVAASKFEVKLTTGTLFAVSPSESEIPAAPCRCSEISQANQERSHQSPTLKEDGERRGALRALEREWRRHDEGGRHAGIIEVSQ